MIPCLFGPILDVLALATVKEATQIKEDINTTNDCIIHPPPRMVPCRLEYGF